MYRSLQVTLLSFCAVFFLNAYADVVNVPMALVNKTGTGKSIGSVTLKDVKSGLLITPDLSGLTPGLHGLHIHQNASCADAGMAAGGHLDPENTGKHAGPYNDAGHLGDLPALSVDSTGHASLAVLAPRLTVSEIKDHALMIHAGGDNYTDTPPMGGGGARIACGVIK